MPDGAEAGARAARWRSTPGFLEHTDHHVGRLVDALEDLEVLDDTLIYYIIGDNGASAEGSLQGTFNEMITLNGFAALETPEFMRRARSTSSAAPEAYNHYAVGWAHAMDTPYQWTKQVASHLGGTRNGTIVHWPRGHHGQGRDPPPVPPRHRRRADHPRGRRAARSRRSSTACSRSRSRASAWPTRFDDADAPRAARDAVLRDVRQPRHLPQGLDGGDQAPHAVGDWLGARAGAFDDDVWELYDTDTDWTQAHDLAAEHPEKLRRAAAAVADRGGRSTTCCRWTTASPSGSTPTSPGGPR